MSGWGERRKELITAYLEHAKRHPRKPTPTYQKVALWVMVFLAVVAWAYMQLHG